MDQDSLRDHASARYRFGSGRRGPEEDRVAALLEAREIYRSLDEFVDVAWCELDLGIVAVGGARPDLDRAMTHFQEARDGFRGHEYWRGVAMAVAKIANLHAVAGRANEARRVLATLDDIEIIDPAASASLASSWADLHLATGDIPAALDELQHKLGALRRAGRDRDLLATNVRIGQLLVNLGRLEEAKSHADQGESMQRAAGPMESARLPRLRAEIAIKQGEPMQAIRHLDDALSTVVRPFERATLLMMYAGVASRNDLHDVAVDRYESALQVSTEAGLPLLRAQAHDGLAFELGDADPTAALSHAQAALAISDESDSPRMRLLVRRCRAVIDIALKAGLVHDHVKIMDRLEQLLAESQDPKLQRWAAPRLADARTEVGDMLGARRATNLGSTGR